MTHFNVDDVIYIMDDYDLITHEKSQGIVTHQCAKVSS